MSAFGFHSLSSDGLAHVIGQYERGLREFEAGLVNYPCGESPRTVRKWLKAARAEMADR